MLVGNKCDLATERYVTFSKEITCLQVLDYIYIHRVFSLLQGFIKNALNDAIESLVEKLQEYLYIWC